MIKFKWKNIFGLSLSVISLIAVSALVTKKTTFFNRAYTELTGAKADIYINAGAETKPLNTTWKYFAQGGESVNPMLAPAALLMREIDPAYIRIDHVFDRYNMVSRSSDGSLMFDFTTLDIELQSIKDMGAKPFISLSYMPSVISSGSEIDLPVSWSDWELSVQKLVEHVSGSGGLAITDVYYEVWNEPDLFGSFKLTGAKNYLALYYHSERGAIAAKSVLPFHIGGPATTALYKNWFDSLIKYVDENNLRLDFYSWHKYTPNVNDYVTDISNAKEWLEEYPDHTSLEFIISEFGPDSEISPIYDETKSAYHALSSYVALTGTLDKSFLFEIKDGKGPKQFWGRWGIMTNEEFGAPIKKPRYDAISFLNQLNGNQLPTLGNGYWVKTMATISENNTIQILLTNYDEFELHLENVPLVVGNIPYASATIKKSVFLGETTQKREVISSGIWRSTISMPPNSTLLLEISEDTVSPS